MLRVDVELEMLRTDRELLARVVAKQHAQQLGEDFAGFDDRRHGGTMRGEDRRAAKAAAAERDRLWVEHCKPTLVNDRYGVARYQYVAAG